MRRGKIYRGPSRAAYVDDEGFHRERDTTPNRYFTALRLDWIEEMLEIYGFINRVHLERKFWISTAQGATDFRRFMEERPGRMVYNAERKRYETTEVDVLAPSYDREVRPE